MPLLTYYSYYYYKSMIVPYLFIISFYFIIDYAVYFKCIRERLVNRVYCVRKFISYGLSLFAFVDDDY